jgi:hypothetical protein
VFYIYRYSLPNCMNVTYNDFYCMCKSRNFKQTVVGICKRLVSLIHGEEFGNRLSISISFSKYILFCTSIQRFFICFVAI